MKIGDRVLCVKGRYGLIEHQKYTICDVRYWQGEALLLRLQGVDGWWSSECFQLGTKALRTLSDDLASALDAVDAEPSPEAWGEVRRVLASMLEKASGFAPDSLAREAIGSEPTPDPIGSDQPFQPGDRVRVRDDVEHKEPFYSYMSGLIGKTGEVVEVDTTSVRILIDDGYRFWFHRDSLAREVGDTGHGATVSPTRDPIGSKPPRWYRDGMEDEPEIMIGHEPARDPEITADEVSPGTEQYIVTHPHDTTLEKGDVVIMVEDPEFRNWLLRLSDYTLHALLGIDDQYVHLVKDTHTREAIGSEKDSKC